MKVHDLNTEKCRKYNNGTNILKLTVIVHVQKRKEFFGMKKILITLLALLTIGGAMTVSAQEAEEAAVEEIAVEEAVVDEEAELAEVSAAEAVAKVGDVYYATIDEAVAAWTNNTTLTLMRDVTLSGVIELSSTEMHTLDLGTFIMTAADKKNAISIIPNGRSKASYALDIYADADNPGGITAIGGSCIYSKGKNGMQDRPIIRIYGGNFTGGYAINHSVSNGTKCPQFLIYGGTFDQISTNRAMLQIYGGTFNKKNYISPDSSAYTRIEGGRFFDIGNNMNSALNADKWTYGTSKGVFDVTVYVDADGYYVVEKDVTKIPEFKAIGSVTQDKVMGQYKSTLVLSKANTEGIGYVNAKDSLVKAVNSDDRIILFESAAENVRVTGNTKVDMSADGVEYTGDVVLTKKDATFTIVFDSENPYEGTVTPVEGYLIDYTTEEDTALTGTIVTRTYFNKEAPVKIGDTPYATIQDALAEVKKGETITLYADIELSKSVAFAGDVEFTIDGNGHKITPASDSTEANSAFNFGQGNDSTRANRKYNFKNITFEGWTTDHVLRLQGTTSVIENCTFVKNNQPDGLGLITLTFADAAVKNCTFENNTCTKAIDINSWGDGSASDVVIDECTFIENTCTQNAVVLVSAGASTTVKNSAFVNNKVTSAVNGATLYLGYNYGISATDNLFKGNVVEISSTDTYAARPYRSAGAIFAGFADENCGITGNAFLNNTLKLDDADAAVKAVAYSAYYGAGDISGNYWEDGTEPVEGADYTYEFANQYPLVIDDYYSNCTTTEGKYSFDLSGLKYVVNEIKLEFADVTAQGAEGEKLYDIKLTATDKIINRLNSVDLTFVLTNEYGKNEFEIIASNDEIVINPVNNSTDRYEFHYNGKTDVDTDTAETITIGQVKFTGYGKFTFAVKTADTNAAHATTNDDNIVDTFVPGGVLEDGTKVGEFDVSASFTNEITVPTRTLTINIDFPNSVEKNCADYQQMTVKVYGGDLANEIVIALADTDADIAITGEAGKADAKYTVDADTDNKYTVTVENVLTANNAYNVEVSGAGYRTARYTVTMQSEAVDGKILNFWNNVKDNAIEVEVGKESSEKNVTFLAGDIVKDSVINIYDLSAVVSYFGEIELDENNKSEYAKYDLNRDGKIDSRDVAYVLVSWGK